MGRKLKLKKVISIFLFNLLLSPLNAASPDLISIGGVGYRTTCDSEGLTLKALNPTYRLFGYRNSINKKYFVSEVINLKKDCSVALLRTDWHNLQAVYSL